MESNNDYRQLCKVPRSNYWHAAKHISTLILFFFPVFFLFFFYRWPLLCSCGHRKFVSFTKLCRHWRSRAYEKCDWILFSCVFFSHHLFRRSHFGSRQRIGHTTALKISFHLFSSVNLDYGANDLNFSEYVKQLLTKMNLCIFLHFF